MRRCCRWPRVLYATCLVGIGSLGAPTVLGAQEGPPVRLSGSSLTAAWEASIAFEAQGDLRGARAVMVTAFGVQPDRYDPCARLAWLTLRLGDSRGAVALYRRARALPGGQEASGPGLALALATYGYAELGRGALATARASWSEAITLDPASTDAHAGLALVGSAHDVSGEVWGAALNATPGASRAFVTYAQGARRIGNTLAVRGAFRHVGSPTFTGTTGAFAAQTELYGGVSKDVGIANIELLAFSLISAGETDGGAAVHARIGGNFGLTATASVIGRVAGQNVQAAPMAFAFLGPYVSVAVGARLTSDSSFSAVSPMVAASLHHGPLFVDVTAHTGEERWAFSAAGPTILSFLFTTSRGFTATLGYGATSNLTIFAQAQREQLADGGSFQSLGLGARFARR